MKCPVDGCDYHSSVPQKMELHARQEHQTGISEWSE